MFHVVEPCKVCFDRRSVTFVATGSRFCLKSWFIDSASIDILFARIHFFLIFFFS